MTAIPAEDAALMQSRKTHGFTRTMSAVLENRLAVVGLGIIVAFTLFCYVGPLVYHTDQVHIELSQAAFFGTVWGAIAGYAGGFIDSAMMRIVDALLAVPALFLLLFLASIARPTAGLLILVIALVSWLGPARLVRGTALSLRTRDFVTSTRLMGGGPWRAVFRHIAPNAIGTVVVNATFQVADAILILAALSFLGLGIPPPAANWGDMLSSGISYTYAGYWWLIYPPGLAIVFVVIAFNFLGDALRDSFDVRLQKR
jgi:peptide/nickel transport system permease protein